MIEAKKMRTLVILSLAIAAALAAPTQEISPYIVGGTNAVPGEFPFICSLQWTVLGANLGHICGASILSPLWLLSAAHCFTEIPQFGSLVAACGRHNLAATEPTEQRIGVDRAGSVIHDGWVSGPQVGPDDLVLVKANEFQIKNILLNRSASQKQVRLVSALTLNVRVRPVLLPQPNVVATGTGILSGWGSTGGVAAATILQRASLTKMDINECRAAFFALGLNGNLVDDTNFCTGPLTGGVSACSGDSGNLTKYAYKKYFLIFV